MGELSTKRSVELKNGDVLELEMSDEFKLCLANYYGLTSFDDITDNHIIMYVYGALDTAMLKAESEGITE